MIKMMMQFGSYLKYNGFTISPASMNNAIAALEWVELLNQDQVYAALEACLVQSVIDREKFQSLFNKFFGDNTPIELEQENNVFRMQVEQFTQEMREGGDYISHILADYIEGDVLSVMENVGSDPLYRVVYDETSSGVGMSKEKVRQEIIKRINHLVDKAEDFAAVSFHMPREKREALSDFLRQHLMEVGALIEQKEFPSFGRRHLMPWEKQRTLANISFDKISLDEQEQVREEVERIAQKLKDALSRQKKRARSGHIDIKNTIRSSMKFGGIPFNVRMKEPNRKKGKIIALCDISMSVAFAAQFMLLLLYRLQNRFSKIRSFIFIRHTYEISQYFAKYPLETALQKAVSAHNIGMGQLTNYALSFRSFIDTYGNALNKDTTLLILGDGVNNHNEPKAEYLKEMADKVARTIWLNPEEEKHWYGPSSAMSAYKPICTDVVECATLDQLSDFTRNLVL